MRSVFILFLTLFLSPLMSTNISLPELPKYLKDEKKQIKKKQKHLKKY